MKILIALTLITFNIYAQLVKKSFVFKDFEAAKSSKNRLQFIVESTKVGLFSSDVDGYVKKFEYSYHKHNNSIKNMTIKFNVSSMDTDNESRDEKLHNLCLSHKLYPHITLKVKGPLKLDSRYAKKYEGMANIRGKEKKFVVILSLDPKSKNLQLNAASTWSLKNMEIPDPSIAVAKLSDDIKINITISE